MGTHRRLVLVPALLVLVHASTLQLTRPVPLAPAPPALRPAPTTTPEQLLADRGLAVPVKGVPRHRLKDTFDDGRGKGRKHKAIDIMAAWGTPVVAADDGRIEKISRNRGGGLSLYQVDSSGRFVYYYAHLAGYADGLREGQDVRRGDVIGYVGTTGNAPESAPHLHFAVMLLKGEKRWWGGEVVNPYAALRDAS
ncbi:MAG: M23 family metallopeptidase [Burkholderiales bacterium]|nr:M23 family metallopeptidase [Burkholderiales bacterium]